LLIILLLSEIFILIGKYHVLSMYYDETIHNWRLWWLPSSVVCGILFKNINSCSVIWSPSINSAGRPHFHVPCPACVLFWLSRSGTATLFVNVFTLFTIVNIAAVEPSVEHAKVVLHTSCTDDWLRPVRVCLSHSACWCLNVQLVANLSRMSCNLCALQKACARNHSYTVNREHITFADIIQHSTLTSRFHDTQTLEYTVNLTIDKIQSMKLIKVQPIPLGVSFSKDQSSKLEHLFCHVSVKREVWALSFELRAFETAFEIVTPSGIGCTFLDPLSIIKVLLWYLFSPSYLFKRTSK